MRSYRWFALVTTVATLGLMLLGGYVKSTGAGLACPDWPKCFGVWYPFGPGGPEDFRGFTTAQVVSEWTHRLVAAVVGPMILGLAVATWMRRPRDMRAVWSSTVAVGLLPVQVLMGGVTVTSGLKPLVVVSHLGLATLIFGGLVMTTVFAFWPPLPPGKARAAPADRAATQEAGARAAGGDAVAYGRSSAMGGHSFAAPAAHARAGATFRDYVALAKPGILFLLLVAAGASLVLAPGDLTILIAASVLVGGGMSAASAAMFNHVIERDRDQMMVRTRDRPVAAQRVPVANALVLAGTLAVLSVVVMGLGANWLAAALSFSGLLFYVFVYTMWLKPRTPQNIVIGGAAGCFPALAGWAAVTGDLSVPAFLLAALVFLWTPPHFWALAIVYKEDYAKAGFPMHPVVHGERSTKVQMLVYALLTVLASLLLVWPWTVLGPVYLVSALALGALFVWYSWVTLRSEERRPARRLFWYSIVYLTALYGAMLLDRALVL